MIKVYSFNFSRLRKPLLLGMLLALCAVSIMLFFNEDFDGFRPYRQSYSVRSDQENPEIIIGNESGRINIKQPFEKQFKKTVEPLGAETLGEAVQRLNPVVLQWERDHAEELHYISDRAKAANLDCLALFIPAPDDALMETIKNEAKRIKEIPGPEAENKILARLALSNKGRFIMVRQSAKDSDNYELVVHEVSGKNAFSIDPATGVIAIAPGGKSFVDPGFSLRLSGHRYSHLASFIIDK